MAHDIPLLISLFAPLVVFTIFGVNAAVVFLSLCLGQVLVQYVGTEAISGLTTLSPHLSELNKSMLQLGLLLAPAVASTFIMIGSVRGKIKKLINILPSMGVGLLATLMGVPLFTPGLRKAIESGSFWKQLSRAEALAVGVTALVSLIFLWTQRRSIKSIEGSGSKHRG